MKKSIKRIIAWSQVVGWTALGAVACTHNNISTTNKPTSETQQTSDSSQKDATYSENKQSSTGTTTEGGAPSTSDTGGDKASIDKDLESKSKTENKEAVVASKEKNENEASETQDVSKQSSEMHKLNTEDDGTHNGASSMPEAKENHNDMSTGGGDTQEGKGTDGAGKVTLPTPGNSHEGSAEPEQPASPPAPSEAK